jgi:hypothetical protein
LKDVKLTDKNASSLNFFKSGIDVGFTTLGSILSCNIITPILRNKIAANRQQDAIAKMNKKNSTTDISNQDISKNYLPKPSMNTFQASSSMAYRPSSGLKI